MSCETKSYMRIRHIFLISNFRHVLNVVCFVLGNSPASEIQTPENYPEGSMQQSDSCFNVQNLSLKPFYLCSFVVIM